MNHPAVLLADQPAGALKVENRERVFEMLLALVRGEGTALALYLIGLRGEAS